MLYQTGDDNLQSRGNPIKFIYKLKHVYRAYNWRVLSIGLFKCSRQFKVFLGKNVISYFRLGKNIQSSLAFFGELCSTVRQTDFEMRP